MRDESLDIPGMLEVLSRHNVEFIVVGGVRDVTRSTHHDV